MSLHQHTKGRTTSLILLAIPTGTVLLIVMMTPSLAHLATSLTAFSNEVVSTAMPAPWPSVFVGVSTHKNTISATLTQPSRSVENTKFGSLAGPSSSTTSASSRVLLRMGSVPSRVTRIRR
jgi:hypothetical protein